MRARRARDRLHPRGLHARLLVHGRRDRHVRAQHDHLHTKQSVSVSELSSWRTVKSLVISRVIECGVF